MTTLSRVAAVAGSTAFAASAVVHTMWGLGSAWPMRTRAELADAVVGSNTVPDARACFAVAGLSVAAAALAAGVGGSGRAAQAARFVLGAGILARGTAGGRPATKVLGLPEPSARFVRLDKTLYRPLCLGVAAAVFTAARR
ncbi:DUF3995 domain-containing protein [Arthrobacter sp. 35W]|uniref:DUF3995 domain-containing protein n=1 Tax=Arthrobacter sp. 35W TaxID=1132441 RepID=UPI00040D897F|nr:DUF3995 domain-containing protein [Arthrobacter sp. 35W]